MRWTAIFFAVLLGSASTSAQVLPPADNFYQTATNAQNTSANLACFTKYAVLREVIGSGDSFQHRMILACTHKLVRTLMGWKVTAFTFEMTHQSGSDWRRDTPSPR